MAELCGAIRFLIVYWHGTLNLHVNKVSFIIPNFSTPPLSIPLSHEHVLAAFSSSLPLSRTSKFLYARKEQYNFQY